MGKLPSESWQPCELANGSRSVRKKRHRVHHLPKKLASPVRPCFYQLLREDVKHCRALHLRRVDRESKAQTPRVKLDRLWEPTQ
jgi:hypothetical protein